MNRILTDIGIGMTANEAIQRYTGSLSVFESEFAEFAKTKANEMAPQLDFQPLPAEGIASQAVDPTKNYWLMHRLASSHIQQGF